MAAVVPLQMSDLTDEFVDVPLDEADEGLTEGMFDFGTEEAAGAAAGALGEEAAAGAVFGPMGVAAAVGLAATAAVGSAIYHSVYDSDTDDEDGQPKVTPIHGRKKDKSKSFVPVKTFTKQSHIAFNTETICAPINNNAFNIREAIEMARFSKRAYDDVTGGYDIVDDLTGFKAVINTDALGNVVLAFRGTTIAADSMVSFGQAAAENTAAAGNVLVQDHAKIATSVENIFTDLAFQLVQIGGIDQSKSFLRMHEGFLTSLTRMKSRIDEKLAVTMSETSTLKVTGHSAGAGISVAFMLLNSLFPVESVYLFGSPRCVDGHTREYYNARWRSITYNIMNDYDPVTHMPPQEYLDSQEYFHVGQVVNLHKSKPLDINKYEDTTSMVIDWREMTDDFANEIGNDIYKSGRNIFAEGQDCLTKNTGRHCAKDAFNAIKDSLSLVGTAAKDVIVGLPAGLAEAHGIATYVKSLQAELHRQSSTPSHYVDESRFGFELTLF